MKVLKALIFATLTLTGTSFADILHLELGVANYSAEDGNSPRRFAVLGAEFRELVRVYGKTGTIYLNDIDESGLKMAVDYARFWIGEHHYDGIRIVPLPGDYHRIAIPPVKTANLNNPSGEQLPQPESDNYREEFLQKIHARNVKLVGDLERIALQSETGLKITSYYYHPNYPALSQFRHLVRYSEWIDTGQIAHPYVGPAGQSYITNDLQPRTYWLKPNRCNALSHKQGVWVGP